jgi:hypothetical protein
MSNLNLMVGDWVNYKTASLITERIKKVKWEK